MNLKTDQQKLLYLKKKKRLGRGEMNRASETCGTIPKPLTFVSLQKKKRKWCEDKHMKK